MGQSERHKVWVNIETSTVENDEKEVLQLGSESEHYKEDNGTDVFVYEETEISGMEGTQTTLRVEKEKVSVVRLGGVNSFMEFETGKRVDSIYQTPYGAMNMGVLTKNIEVNYNEENFPVNIKVDYQVELEGISNSDNSLNIDIIH
jgi:uncharacterized beta-barrel protein YwiB (DUF1934 family)